MNESMQVPAIAVALVWSAIGLVVLFMAWNVARDHRRGKLSNRGNVSPMVAKRCAEHDRNFRVDPKLHRHFRFSDTIGGGS